MKTLSLLLILLISSSFTTLQKKADALVGAWSSEENDLVKSVIFSDRFFALSVYDIKNKNFISTEGGAWRKEGDKLLVTYEFHTADTAKVGQEVAVNLLVKGNNIVLAEGEQRIVLRRDDSGSPGKFSGAWLITARMQEGTMNKMNPGPRKTMKILSGKKFQWVAYNVETKEFFGTGGGSYTTKKGKYNESIEFFSRDNSRVGKSLQFDFQLDDNQWRHKGLSSKGDPIDEIWMKRETLGI